MLDRIDIHIEVPRVDYEKLSDDRLGEPSANVQARVEAARERQRGRFGETKAKSLAMRTCARRKSGSIASSKKPAIR